MKTPELFLEPNDTKGEILFNFPISVLPRSNNIMYACQFKNIPKALDTLDIYYYQLINYLEYK